MNYFQYFYKLLNNEDSPAVIKNIVYIHGANATHRSFRYIQKNLPKHNALNFEYHVNTPYADNIKELRKNIFAQFGTENVVLIGHSMGGLMAVELLEEYPTAEKAFTMSAPFGGSKFIEYLRWICPNYQMFKDLSVKSPVIRKIMNLKFTKPVMQIVTTGCGNPLFGETNDGTVTLSSQRALPGVVYKEYELGHNEVLLSEQIIEEITKFAF